MKPHFVVPVALMVPVHALQSPMEPAQTRVAVDSDAHVIAGGEYTQVPVTIDDDQVPLPIPALVVPGDDGDRVVEPASGDPFFLGFVAGKYYPAADERIDPDLLASLRSHYGDGRPEQETYAFVMFQKRMTDARLQQLRDVGARVLEFHPHYCLKVALSPTAVDTVAALDFVRWIGSPKVWQKVHSSMAAEVNTLPDGKLLDVYVNVFDSDLCPESTSQRAGVVEFGGPDGVVTVVEDPSVGPRVWMSNGWQQRVLQELGVDVREYVDSIRAFRARISPSQIEALVALDFVQFVEPERTPQLGHDESMPMILADATRVSYDGAGAGVAGQADSGIDYSHNGISGYYWWANNLSGTTEATTDDPCEHGTHVGGTIHGSGAVEDSYEGAANGLGNLATTRYFNTKIFYGAGCSYGGSSMATILGATDGAITDSNGDVTPRPHAVNHSWGSPSPAGGSFGTEADCRTIDASVYTNTQLQVIIAHNWGPGAGTVSEEGSSKNALTIGGVRDYASGAEDPGEMYTSSGRGPTADNRWKPNVVAPATSIRSAQAQTSSSYVNKSGTSMAAPHVTGLAAQLTDHYAFLRHNPTTLGALLMASAMTKDNQLLSSPSTSTTHHLNNYGAGRVEAYKAHFGVGGLSFWGWTQGSGAGTYVDVPISAGATRLSVCMYYHEIAASSGASSALINDLDLYIDAPSGGISTTTNTGEYVAQQSPRDNTEIRLLNNPESGTWRIKVHPQSVTSTCRVGLAVLVHFDDTTPDGTFNVTASDLAIKPNTNVNITATAYNPEYIASAVFYDSTSTGDTLQASIGVLEDGATASYMTNQQSGRDVLVGDIKPNDSRTVVWTTRWATEGFKLFSVNARSDNWIDKTDSVSIAVDGTPPPLPTGLICTTHTPGVWSNAQTVGFQWTQPADNVSGVNGYSTTLAGLSILPDTTADLGAVTSYVTNFNVTQSGNWFFNLRPVDRSDNWNPSHVSIGPIRVDFVQPNYITGLTSTTHSAGSTSCNGTVTVVWDPMTDGGGSGVAGASYVWDHSAITTPDTSLESGPGATSFTTTLAPSLQPWYFHIRPYDNAGNGQNQFHFGPLYVVPSAPASYCTGKTNSLGCVPTIGSSGTASKSAGNLVITCTNVINQKNGLLFWGNSPSNAPFQGGIKCVASPTVRTQNQSSGGASSGNSCTGSFSFAFDTAYMNSVGVMPGDTIHAQWWMRDPASASTTGLSNALQLTVCQ